MRILLVDVDSKIPNIALGKLSTYWKARGAEVVFIKLKLTGFIRNAITKIIDGSKYDKVFVSNIFTGNQNKFKVVNCSDVSIGGVGSIHPLLRLPDEINKAEVDYSLWPENNKSYGFITRGCIRKCKFCFVPKIEGKLRFENTIDSIVRHKIVIFLDNNILAYKEHKQILQELVDKKIICQFNQGLDIRLVDDENAKLLSKIKYYEKYICAFDDIKDERLIERGFNIIKKYITAKWRIRFLIYYNAANPLKDLVYRVNWCKQSFIYPYIMPDKNCTGSLYQDFIISYRGYVGSIRGHFFKISFGQWLYSEEKPKDRIQSDLQIYKKALRGEI